MTDSRENIVTKVSINIIILNTVLSIFKLFAGIFAHSAAMISDAVNSAADVIGSVIVLIGVKLATKASDKDHPYGHERLECVAAIILSVILFATGAGIGLAGLQKIFSDSYEHLAVPGVLALVAAVVAIAVKEVMYRYTSSIAKKVDSAALMADAWNHRSDALASLGGFIGILGARLGMPILDPVACVVICLFIIKAAVKVFLDAVRRMTDTACDDKTSNEIKEIVANQEGVLSVDLLNTRLFGDKIYVDIEISADEDLPLRVTHGIAQRVQDAIERKFAKVKHCMVHVNPAKLPE